MHSHANERVDICHTAMSLFIEVAEERVLKEIFARCRCRCLYQWEKIYDPFLLIEYARLIRVWQSERVKPKRVH